MKRNVHFIVPKAKFELVRGGDALSEYTFNTHRARHLFCRRCGICPFYIPRSNPDGVAVTVYCLDAPSAGQPTWNAEVRKFDGMNWELHIAESGIALQSKL